MADIKQYTFISLFDSQSDENGDDITINKIEIPIIQRDYAQGRKTPTVKRIRERFLKSLKNALISEGNGITLDFVYGYRKNNGILIPLDGQQRLTTLFLLHWYIARHEHVDEIEFSFLDKFSYATRASARDFCENLVHYNPAFEEYPIKDNENQYKLSLEIIDQEWMPIDWMNDPTIASMLEMLDCIHDNFKETSDLWRQLQSGRISFYFLPIDQMGLTDDLYIKMNSRGKPLTEFEHFKAEWEGCVKSVDNNLATEISHKIDTNWTDLLWFYRNVNTSIGENIIDEEFTCYFLFLCDIIYYKNPDLERKENLLDIAHQLFSNDCPEAIDNINFIINGFDCWDKVDGDIYDVFDKFISNNVQHIQGKSLIRLKQDESIDLFRECCAKYCGDLIGGHKRSFTLQRAIQLYCFVFYLMNFEAISEEQFARRFRIVNNLIKASEFELRDNNNVMRNIVGLTEQILLEGVVQAEGEDNTKSFNINQIKEEQAKILFINEHPELAETIFKLEDNDLLNGAIRVLGTENLDLADKFVELFKCDRGLVHNALLTFGDYSMKVSTRYEMGAANRPQNWRDIFRNNATDIQSTKNVLIKLLRNYDTFNNDVLISIIKEYLSNTTIYDWRYYFVKYNAFLNSPYMMFYWLDQKDIDKEGYKIIMMQTEKSLTGRNYNIFLKTVFDIIRKHDNTEAIKMDEYAYHDEKGGKLMILPANQYITVENSTIKFWNAGNDEVVNVINISQNPDGQDIIDRVELTLVEVGKLLGYESNWYNYKFSYIPARPISDEDKVRRTVSTSTKLSVFIPNKNITIEHDLAKETFIDAILEAGIDNVRPLNLEICNVPLISDRTDTGYSQSEVQPGVWVITHCSTLDKKRKLEQISEQLQLNWIVKIISK